MDRLLGTWYPDNVENWPFEERNFGKDADLFYEALSNFFMSFNDDGTGEWSLGLMSGTLKVRAGQQSGHFMGELLVVESTNETEGWKARLNVTLEPKKTARISWAWDHGPTKGTATTTYWALDGSYYDTTEGTLFPAPYRRANRSACALM